MVLTNERAMALAQAEALVYMICATFFDGPDTLSQIKAKGRLEASIYLLNDLLEVAAGGGEH